MQTRKAGKKKTTNRLTIAFFSSSPGGSLSYEKWQLWRGVAETAAKWDMNLIYVAGEEFENHPQAVLYDLIGTDNVEGLITWNSFVSPRTQIDKYQDFIDQYLPIPTVSIELALERTSNLLIDNKQGVQELVSHLVEFHHYKKIAFVGQRDNSSSLERQSAFCDYLEELGILNPDLIGEMVELDQRGLIPGKDYQAIVAQSDLEGLQVAENLEERGIQIPKDVAITGFNDGRDARGSQPALTTIRLPFRNMGQRAVEMLVHRINGNGTTETSFVPLQLVLRRSCGCLEPMAEQAAVGHINALNSQVSEVLVNQRPRILTELVKGMGTSVEILAKNWAEGFFDVFTRELLRYQSNGTNDLPSLNYLQNLSLILQQAVVEGSNVSRWHEAITILRLKLLPYLHGDDLKFAEDLFQQARVLVGQAAVRAELHRGWQMSQRAEILRDFESALLTAPDFADLLDILVQGLERLELGDFYLVLYEGLTYPYGRAKLVLAYQDHERIEFADNGIVFNTRNILPEGFLVQEDPYSLLLVALHQGDEQIGYALFKSPPPLDATFCDIYEALRIQLSSALKGVKLRLALQDALQRAEEANQLKSQFLSMVSHELRTPLNLIVGLSEMALRQQNHGKRATRETQEKYLEQIYVSGQHLDRLIRDVLDLASSQIGQMKLLYEPLNPVPVLEDAACMAEQLAEQKKLQFRAEIPKNLPLVSGDKTRLRQILLNLLSNAVKFTARGEVVLKARLENDLIHISIADTGLGIAKEEQERIFDEFYQSDRSSARGYGGIGLGLAITRKLVEYHGGQIWVRSNGANGGGSIFNFTLPVMTDTSTLIEQPNGFDSKSVVILTQTPDEEQRLVEHLGDYGFNVEVVEIDEQAAYLTKLSATHPGAVILDLIPDAEIGWQIMQLIKESPATHDIPVLFYSLITDQDSGYVLEVDYLTKPIGKDELVSALQKYGLSSIKTNHGFKVLIIDDEPGILDLHTQIVASEFDNCQILTATNGILGLMLMRQNQPDLVLLDLMMPELDGFGVLNSMQDEQLLRNIPVIILSGQSLNKQEMNRLSKSVAAVMGKGLFTREEMLDRIDAVISHRKRLGSEPQRLVQRAMAYIHENYTSNISRSDVADHLCVNEQYLSRCFKNEIGIGPITYLSRYRIDQAKQLLEQGDLSITQVAMEIGLSSQSYFSRLFQQETGITPSAYRRGERVE